MDGSEDGPEDESEDRSEDGRFPEACGLCDWPHGKETGSRAKVKARNQTALFGFKNGFASGIILTPVLPAASAANG